MNEPDLISAWRAFSPGSPPYLLEGDEALLERRQVVTIRSTKELIGHSEFDFQGNGTLHLGLLPVPFAGDLSEADIFILLQNPGFRPSDYFAELEDQQFREALRTNLNQQPPADGFSFPYLNPSFSYQRGYEYWRGKLRDILSAVITQHGCLLQEALQVVSRRIAVLELFPYHSSVGALGAAVLRNLRSVDLVRRFVHNDLTLRARRGEALLIVTRQARLWGLKEEDGIVVYGPSEARSAHLSLQSRGGAAIAEWLEVKHRAS